MVQASDGHYDTEHNDTWHNDIQHNDIQHNSKQTATPSIMAEHC